MRPICSVTVAAILTLMSPLRADDAKSLLPAEGQIVTVAGAGGKQNNGNVGKFDQVNVGQTFGVEVGPDGALYICEVENHRLWRLDPTIQKMAVIAGNGRRGYNGDGGLATEASMNEPYEVRFDQSGNLYVVEMQNHVVRRIDATTKQITTVAGNGQRGYAGDNGLATKAKLNRPHSIAIHGNFLFIADIGNHRIRRVDLRTNIIDSIAGNGEKQLPRAGKTTGQPMVGPRALYATEDTLWIALREGHSIWKLDLNSELLQHVAGSGEKGYFGDDGPDGSALTAKFNGPKGIVVDENHRAYVVDTENQVIRRIDTKRGTVTTVAGNGKRGWSGDGGPAKLASTDRPHGICVNGKGVIFIGDTNNHRVRAVRDTPASP